MVKKSIVTIDDMGCRISRRHGDELVIASMDRPSQLIVRKQYNDRLKQLEQQMSIKIFG